MTDPVTITAATIVALAASKFVEAAAGKAGEAVLTQAGKQVDALWSRIKKHFAGNKRAESAIAQIETKQSKEALTRLEVYLDDELSDPENEAFAQDLQQIAQQIINIGQQNQTQKQTNFDIDARDNARVNAVGEINNAQTVNFGDPQP